MSRLTASLEREAIIAGNSQIRFASTNSTVLGGVVTSAARAPKDESHDILSKLKPQRIRWNVPNQTKSGTSSDFDKLNKRAFVPAKVMIPGRIKLFRKIAESWGFDRKVAARILGLDDESSIGEIFSGVEKIRQRDMRDRLGIFLSTAVDLDGLYDDEAAIRVWLDQPKALVDKKSPRELLEEAP
jgi:hypothetical protein